jgi:hypothetical protein
MGRETAVWETSQCAAARGVVAAEADRAFEGSCMRRLVDRGLALRELLRTHPALAWQRHIWVRRMMRLIGYLVCFGLLADVAYRALHNFGVAHVNVADLVWASLAGIVSWAALAGGWVTLSHGVAAPRLALWNWVRTQLLRYIPGAVWGPAARAKTSPTRLRRGVTLVLAEQALSLGFAVLLGTLILAVVGDRLWALGAGAAAVGLTLLILLGGRVGIRPRVAATAVGVYAVSYIAYALAATAAQRALGPVPSPGRVAGVAVLAWVVGVVVVTAPGGLGAREGFYVAMLAAIMPASHAPLSAGAVVSRLVMMLAEVLLFVVAAVAWRRRPKRGAHAAELPGLAELEPVAEEPVLQGFAADRETAEDGADSTGRAAGRFSHVDISGDPRDVSEPAYSGASTRLGEPPVRGCPPTVPEAGRVARRAMP